MQLVRWNPMRDMLNAQSRISTLFDDFFNPDRERGIELALWNWQPKVDIYDNENSIVVTAELPGVAKEDIVVDVKDRVLTLNGERGADSEVKADNFYRRERCHGKFQRAFTLPADIDPDAIKAQYKDGVLKVQIPKPEKHQPKQVTVH